jgi:hypothetical protein
MIFWIEMFPVKYSNILDKCLRILKLLFFKIILLKAILFLRNVVLGQESHGFVA